MEIPVISLWTPWANWVALGWKPIETRTHNRFAKLLGQRIGIHASLHWDKDAIDTARPYLSAAQIYDTTRFLRISGAIICTAFVREYRKLNPLDEAGALIDCTHVTRYGLFLSDIEVIEAFPCKGRQGIWYQDISVKQV